MEYHVKLPALLESAECLERTARDQQRTLENLQDTANRIRRLSYMDGVLNGIQRDRRRLEEQHQNTLRMAQSLRRIHQIYLDMENAILDGVELPSTNWDDDGPNPLPIPPVWPLPRPLPPMPVPPRPVPPRPPVPFWWKPPIVIRLWPLGMFIAALRHVVIVRLPKPKIKISINISADIGTKTGSSWRA